MTETTPEERIRWRPRGPGQWQGTTGGWTNAGWSIWVNAHGMFIVNTPIAITYGSHMAETLAAAKAWAETAVATPVI